MTIRIFIFTLLASMQATAAPRFIISEPLPAEQYAINTKALCATAKETLIYLNRGSTYDPQVIHAGKTFKVPLVRVKATLAFICRHQNKLNDPVFIKKHFDFIRWYPDLEQAKPLIPLKPLIARLPKDKILMTKYYVPRAKALTKRSSAYPFALYALPTEEEAMTLEEANAKPWLIRFQYGKQAILKGALINKKVPVLAYLNREDLETALMQGTVVTDFGKNGSLSKILNVHRNNNITYDKSKNPYEQERYWYFKQVDGIKGYGKDAEQKITVQSDATFAADLEQFGLGKLLMVQYPDQKGKIVTRAGILADTGGAFKDNLYQVDFLTGSYVSKEAFYQANRHLPDYVAAYFIVLKKHFSARDKIRAENFN